MTDDHTNEGEEELDERKIEIALEHIERAIERLRDESVAGDFLDEFEAAVDRFARKRLDIEEDDFDSGGSNEPNDNDASGFNQGPREQ